MNKEELTPSTQNQVKNRVGKIRALISIAAALLPISLFVYGIFSNKEEVINGTGSISDIQSAIEDTLSGTKPNYTGIVVNTGSIYPESDWDKYENYIKNGNYVSYFPPAQEKLNGNYAHNTTILREYLFANDYIFKVSKPIQGGYLHMKIGKSLGVNDDIFFHFGTKRDFRGRLMVSDKSKVTMNQQKTEFLIKLQDIPYIPAGKVTPQSIDLLDSLAYFNKENTLAVFLITNKVAHIEEFTISYCFDDCQ